MKLNKISLENIRSYEKQEIVFPNGSILLSGDIGAGKTSILLGIEFALFGLQPGQRGSSLLRNGKDAGKVILEFEADGREVQIERSLKRGKTITQDYCAITVDGEKSEIAVTELKSRVLDLLNYPKEFAKKQNLLYKFTVYTPQEEMKEIILQDSKSRVNTLRHVFGIDKYKRILENLGVIIIKLREEKRLKEGITLGLETDRESLVLKKNELETKRYNLSSVEKELFSKQEARKKIEDERNVIYEKIAEKVKLQSEVEKTKILITTKNDAIIGNERLIDQLKEQIDKLSDIKFDENESALLEHKIQSFKKQKEELNEKNLTITSQMTSLSLKNQENDNLKGKLSSMELGPTCLQDIDPVHKSNVINKTERDTVENVKRIEKLTLEKRQISSGLSKLDYELTESQKRIQDLKILKIRLEDLRDKEKRKEDLDHSNLVLKKDMELLSQHIDSLKNTMLNLSNFDAIYEKKEEELRGAVREERLADIKVAELKKEIDMFSKQIQELSERIEKIESVKQELIYISGLENWLNKEFNPMIANIERNVMVKLKTEFSKLFSEWFGILVSDNFNVELDEDFTPRIQQQDYELDYAYLSGGERTAIALAYRLALNQVINSLLSKIKTKDLVILDEPTDGFSEQQLDKMREVLNELNVSQLLIVSHEQKIEGFVENVIKLKKELGVSGKE